MKYPFMFLASVLVIGLLAMAVTAIGAPDSHQTYHKDQGVFCTKEKTWWKSYDSEKCYFLMEINR